MFPSSGLVTWTVIVLLSTLTTGTTTKTEERHFVVDPRSAFIRRGGTAVLRCTAARGFTVTGWLHDGRPVTPRRRDHLVVSGGLLTIKSFARHGSAAETEASDEGNYQCVATGPQGAFVSRPAQLLTAVLERYRERLSDRSVEVVLGNVAVIPCTAVSRSVPPAHTQFEFNSARLRMTSRHHILPSGSLQIEAAQSSDEGVYRCIAVNPVSNDRLPADNTVALHTLPPPSGEVSPRFSWTPLTMADSLLGDTVTLECAAEAWPVPRVTWQRHGGRLPVSRHRYILGNLVISDVRKSDEGTYVCRADNGNGQPQASVAFLQVKERPVIESMLTDQTVLEGGSAVFDCMSRGTPPLSVTWLHNAVPLAADDQSKRINNFSLVLTSVKRDDAGFYQCVVNNSVAMDAIAMATAYLHVTRPSSRDRDVVDHMRHRPHGRHRGGETTKDNKDERDDTAVKLVPPPRPIATKLSDTSAMLEWPEYQLHGNDLEVTFIKIQYRETSSSSPHSRTWNTLEEDVDPTSRSYVVSGLKPGSVYLFRLVAVYSNNDNKHGRNSDRFFLSSSSVARSRGPSSAPVIVDIQALSDTVISVRWQYMVSTNNDGVDGFYIYYRPYSSSRTVEYRRRTAPAGSRSNYVMLTGLVPDTAYSIRMAAYNRFGISDFSNTAVQKTLGVGDVMERTTWRPDEWHVGVATAESSVATSKVGVASSSRDEALFTALGVALGVVVVAMTMIIVICAWRQRQQRRLLVAVQSRGSDTGYVESKPGSVVQSAQQQSLMSSAYLPTNNFLYHSDDDDDERPRIVNGGGHLTTMTSSVCNGRRSNDSSYRSDGDSGSSAGAQLVFCPTPRSCHSAGTQPR